MNSQILKSLAALFAIALIVRLAVALLSKQSPQRKATGNVQKRDALTEREQAMYFRLQQTFPDCIVLAQVAFSALLNTRDRPTRSTFDRKVADFVLCSKAFEALAVIELDDASHRGREAEDRKRAGILTAAGYRVVRFKNVPDADALRAAIDAKRISPTP